MSSFRYISHSIVKGAIKTEGQPCARKADETLTITLKDEFSELLLKLNYGVSESSDVLVRNIEIINGGKDSLNVEKAFSFCTEFFDDGGYSAMRLAGKWAKERTPVVTPLAEGTLRIDSNYGYSSRKLDMAFAGSVKITLICGFDIIYMLNYYFTISLACDIM